MNKTEDNLNADSAMVDDLELNSIGEIKNELKEKSKQTQNSDQVVISKTKMALIVKLLENIKENNDQLLNLLSSNVSSSVEERISIAQHSDDKFEKVEANENARVVEGVFDGESMIGPDGKQYSVPANYASKSKLIEGDILKLTITNAGTFVYKQIGPIERTRLVANLEQTSTGSFYARTDTNKWKLLTASVTYFKGNHGDEVIILIPKVADSQWAAVENVIKKIN